MCAPEARDRDQQLRYSGRYLDLISTNGWEYASRKPGIRVTAVLAITPDNELILTQQFRPAVGKSVVDLPAGLAGDQRDCADESLATAAARELLEETGYGGVILEELTTVPTSPGLTAETVTLFRANGVVRQGDGGGDETEDIEVLLVPLEGIRDWVERTSRSTCLIDPKVYIGLWFLQNQTED